MWFVRSVKQSIHEFDVNEIAMNALTDRNKPRFIKNAMMPVAFIAIARLSAVRMNIINTRRMRLSHSTKLLKYASRESCSDCKKTEIALWRC